MIIARSNSDKKLLERIGVNIKKFREKADLSQPELGRSIGYKNGYSIHLIEKGKVTGLDIVILLRIASKVGVDLSELLLTSAK